MLEEAKSAYIIQRAIKRFKERRYPRIFHRIDPTLARQVKEEQRWGYHQRGGERRYSMGGATHLHHKSTLPLHNRTANKNMASTSKGEGEGQEEEDEEEDWLVKIVMLVERGREGLSDGSASALWRIQARGLTPTTKISYNFYCYGYYSKASTSDIAAIPLQTFRDDKQPYHPLLVSSSILFLALYVCM